MSEKKESEKRIRGMLIITIIILVIALSVIFGTAIILKGERDYYRDISQSFCRITKLQVDIIYGLDNTIKLPEESNYPCSYWLLNN